MQQYKKILNNIDQVYDSLLIRGISINKKLFGIGFIFDTKPEISESEPWLQIVINLSQEIMKEIGIIDP